jgi:hypothetical protein
MTAHPEGPGGTKKSALCLLRGPAWVALTDFFSAAITFEQSNEIKEFKKPSRFNTHRLVAHLGELIYFQGAGGGQKFRPADRGTGARGAQTSSAICEIFFFDPLGGIKSLALSIADRGARSKDSVAELAEYFFQSFATAFPGNLSRNSGWGGRWPVTP